MFYLSYQTSHYAQIIHYIYYIYSPHNINISLVLIELCSYKLTIFIALQRVDGARVWPRPVQQEDELAAADDGGRGAEDGGGPGGGGGGHHRGAAAAGAGPDHQGLQGEEAAGVSEAEQGSSSQWTQVYH